MVIASNSIAQQCNQSNQLETVLSRLYGVKQSGNGWQALCPAHDDKHPSLSIREGEDGKILLRCWAGCPTEAILAAVGLEMRDLFPAQSTGPRRRSKTERNEAARKQVEVNLERRFRDAVLLVSRELAAMICTVNKILAHGGWEAIMADTPGTAKLTALTHRLSFWEYLAEELLQKGVEAQLAALPTARKEVSRWGDLVQKYCNN